MANYSNLAASFLKDFREMRSSMVTPSPALNNIITILDKKVVELSTLQQEGERILQSLKNYENARQAGRAFRSELFGNNTTIKNLFEGIEEGKEEIYLQQQNQINEKIKNLLLESYNLIMKLREEVTGEKVVYSIGDTRTNRSFIVDESIVYDQATLSAYVTMTQKTINGFNIGIRLNSQRILDKQAESKKIDSNLDGISGSTLWSRGIRILRIIRSYVREQEIKGLGINFGHFYEAYLYFGGNKANFENDHTNPNNLMYAAYMLALANNRGFYLGGDIKDMQAKINSANLINLKSIINELSRLKTIFSNKDSKEIYALLEEHFYQEDVPGYLESRIAEALEKLTSMPGLTEKITFLLE